MGSTNLRNEIKRILALNASRELIVVVGRTWQSRVARVAVQFNSEDECSTN